MNTSESEESTWTCHQCGKTHTDKWWKEPDWFQLRVEKLPPKNYSTVMLRLFCSVQCMRDFTRGDEWTTWST